MKTTTVNFLVRAIGMVSLCLLLSVSFGQNVAITDDATYQADSSAMLDIKSISKGMLIPRLTLLQRDAISNPALGLMIYQIDSIAGIYYYQNEWKLLGAGDNLGNHLAIQNLQLNNNWLSNDGDNEGITISNSGWVGVGLSNPLYAFEVDGSIVSRAANAFRLKMSTYSAILRNDNNGFHLLFTNAGEPDSIWNSLRPFSVDLAAGDVTIGKSLIVKHSSNVGIGTTSPTTKLNVIGNSGISSFTGTNLLGLLIGGSNSNADYSGIDFTGRSSTYAAKPLGRIGILSTSSGSTMMFGTSNNYPNGITNTAMAIDFNGNVGIGTTTPAAKLHVISENNSSGIFESNTNAILTLKSKDSNYISALYGSLGNDLVGALDFRPVTGDLTLWTNDLGGSTWRQRMIIVNSTGNVGIGTTTPAYKLTVAGGANGISVSGGNDGDRLIELKTDRPWYFEQEGDDASTVLRLREYAAGGKSFLIDASGWFGVRSQDGSVYKMIVNNLGNVGIGTTTPIAKLTVQADPTSTDNDILFSVKDKDGNNVFIVYPEWVQVIVPDVTTGDSKSNQRGAFVVSGRGATKGETNFVDLNKKNYLIGHNVASNISDGWGNSIIGYESANLLTTGDRNVVMGYQAGKNISTASGNVYVGWEAGLENNGGTNVMIGNSSGKYVKTGICNVYVGGTSGTPNQYGNYNVMVGYGAGGQLCQGSSNVFLGNNAGANESGSNKLYIDNTMTSSPLIYGEFDNKRIKFNAYVGVNVNPTSTYGLWVDGGTSTTYSLRVYKSALASGSWNTNSDLRWKKDITPIGNALSLVMNLKGIYFNWRTYEFPEEQFNEKHQLGFIAQEVEKIIPELVSTNDDGYKAMDYAKLTPVLVEAIKEQQKQLDQKDQEILELKARLDVIEKFITMQTE